MGQGALARSERQTPSLLTVVMAADLLVWISQGEPPSWLSGGKTKAPRRRAPGPVYSMIPFCSYVAHPKSVMTDGGDECR